MNQTVNGPDGKPRCGWCAQTPDFFAYHDREWGFPVDDDVRLFEKICLEGFQSGLSWRTILAKRENFRIAFKGFDFHKVARFSARDVDRLLDNEGIIRHRGKIEATIENARQAREMVKREGSLGTFFWRYEADVVDRVGASLRSTSSESVRLSKDLKKLGWKFVGPTTCYSFMQAMGLVNDHHPDCSHFIKVERARKKFKRPR